MLLPPQDPPNEWMPSQTIPTPMRVIEDALLIMNHALLLCNPTPKLLVGLRQLVEMLGDVAVHA